MQKKLVLFSDGTGNSSAKLQKTNVWRLFEALEQNRCDVRAIYDDGVGTSSNRYLAALGGAFGWGLKRNALHLYKFVCRNYAGGDAIYGFGFSRGAFTIRVVAGLIAREGLVTFRTEEELDHNAKVVYRSFRTKAFPSKSPVVIVMRALTGSEVLVADKLFATLDTTVRALHPPTHPRVLISDTVGFIRKLPHDLVASFRSTLDEALEASLLLYVVDASDPAYEAQLEVSRTVLREIGAEAIPSRLLLNKIDRLAEAERAALRAKHPDAILVSAKSPPDVAALRETIIGFFESGMVEDELVLPYAKQSLLGEIYDNARVLSEEYDAGGRILKVRGLPGAIARLRRALDG